MTPTATDWAYSPLVVLGLLLCSYLMARAEEGRVKLCIWKPELPRVEAACP